MKEMSTKDTTKFGIEYKNSIMENGEKRFRQICSKDKTAYIRAEGGETGYWQKSHYHKSIKEVYIVQKGTILMAQYINNKVKINKIDEEGIFKIEPNVPHNVYMYPNTVLHTVKYGRVKEYDWESFEQLDDMLKNQSIEELKNMSI